MRLQEFLDQEFTPYKMVKFSLGEIKSKVAIKIIDSFGFDSLQYIHELDNYGVKHVRDRHGKDRYGITDDDFHKIQEIIENPDDVQYAGLSKIGTHSIKYKKIYGELTYCYIEEVRKGRKTLSLKTFYKQRNPLGDASTARGLTHTSAS